MVVGSPKITLAFIIITGVLVLLAAYHYNVHDRTWGFKLVYVSLAVFAFLSLAERFSSLFFPTWLGAALLLVYALGWRWPVKTTTPGCHALRGGVSMLVMGPLLAIPASEYAHIGNLPRLMLWMPARECCAAFGYGLPGFYLAGSVAFLLSVALSPASPSSRYPRLARAGLLAVGFGLALAVNWYVAGALGIHQAAETGALSRLRYIFASRPGAVHLKTHRPDRLGWTPLHFSAFSWETEATLLLLAAGADTAAVDQEGRSPLHCALQDDACAPSQSPKVKSVVTALLHADADVNAPDNQGDRPLRYAAEWEDEGLVVLLLQKGALVDAVNSGGRTALYCAAAFTRLATVEVLLAAGADVNRRAADGTTPLYAAVCQCLPSVGRRGTIAIASPNFSPVTWCLREAGGKTGEELDADQVKPPPAPPPVENVPAKGEPKP